MYVDVRGEKKKRITTKKKKKKNYASLVCVYVLYYRTFAERGGFSTLKDERRSTFKYDNIGRIGNVINGVFSGRREYIFKSIDSIIIAWFAFEQKRIRTV